jgi:hypothetical protein
MAQVDIMKTYRLELKPEEYKLICMGLIELNSEESLQLNRHITANIHKQQELAAEVSKNAAYSAAMLLEKYEVRL